MKKPSFSLIEVIFSASLLIMVGVAMASLNNAAARLVANSEIKLTAQGVNDQALAFLAIKYYQSNPKEDPCKNLATCFVVCDVNKFTNENDFCQVSVNREGIRLESFKQPLITQINIQQSDSQLLAVATTSWGNGIQRQIKGARILE
jgi:hypothetical protein